MKGVVYRQQPPQLPRPRCWRLQGGEEEEIAPLSLQVGYLLTLGDLEWTALPATEAAMEHLAR